MDKDKALRMALEALENNRQTHNYCEDTWYSCPKHEEGCANESEGDECNCGADEANAEIDNAITATKELLAQPEQEPVAWYDKDGVITANPIEFSQPLYTTSPQPEKPDQDEVDIRSRLYQRIHELETQLAQPEHEPVKLRRGDILRCIETDELCTVWFISTTGKTLVKWSANNFGDYTKEQIGELFWLETEPDDLELAAEKSDNYAAFHAGYRFAVAHHLAQPEQEIIPLNIEDGYVRDYLWDRALVAIDEPCTRSHPHENMGAYCKHRTELARIQAQELDKNDEIAIAYGLPKEPEQEPVDYCGIHYLPEPCAQCAKEHEGYNTPPQRTEQEPVAQCTESDSWNCKYCRKTESCKALQDPRNFASPPQRERVLFPTMLRKMWSGSEVQAWLDENVNKEKNT